MAELDLTPLWDKFRDHDKEINQLKIETALTSQKLDNLQESHLRLSKDSAQQHGELKGLFTNLNTNVQKVLDDMNFRQGAKEQKTKSSIDFRWSIGILLTALSLVIAYYAIKT